ncbi:MAG: DUF3301 domain-containing protein [Gammaproteobacteria bacterium]
MFGALVFLLILIGAVWFWADSTKAREFAIQRCVQACREANVQFLDQTVALAALGAARNSRGHLVPRRRYGFDFSTNGQDRHRGQVVMIGRHVEFVRLEHPGGPFLLTGSNVHVIH